MEQTQIPIAQKMDILCSKLVSLLLSVTFTSMEKHTNLLHNLNHECPSVLS